MRTIWKREFQSYFYTPVGYIFLGVFFLVASVLFDLSILQQSSGDLPSFIAQISYLWMLICPILTMRLWAEEKQKRTDQLLLTSPVSLVGVVAGKLCSAFSMLLLTALLSLFYVAVVAIYGTVYPRELAVNLLGFLLLGGVFVSIDFYFSAISRSPAAAAAMSFGANFLLWMLDLVENQVTIDFLSDILSFFSVYSRNESFMMAQLSFADLIYDLSLMGIFAALTVHHLDHHRYGKEASA